MPKAMDLMDDMDRMDIWTQIRTACVVKSMPSIVSIKSMASIDQRMMAT